jgi:hypothetical protein
LADSCDEPARRCPNHTIVEAINTIAAFALLPHIAGFTTTLTIRSSTPYDPAARLPGFGVAKLRNAFAASEQFK